MDTTTLRTPHRYQLLPAGAIRPQGWLLTQIREDLAQGYARHYGSFHDTVCKDRFGANKARSLGGTSYTGEGGFEREWWNGEHEGYWLDGLVRMAFLVDDAALQAQLAETMEHLLAHQDEDGYIGMYEAGDEPGCRYRHPGENGELWTQSRILMVLATYGEFTGDERFLRAVQRAAELSMAHYADGHWQRPEACAGGHSHAIGFIDVLEYLLRRTGDERYARFAAAFYRDFSAHPPRDDDWCLGPLSDAGRPLNTHGAHLTEGLCMPLLASLGDDDEQLRAAAAAVLPKLRRHLCPGGAMVSFENVSDVPGSADASWEYCTNVELLMSLNRLIGLSGDTACAAMIERLALNALQGSRPALLDGLQYLGTDHQPSIDHEGHGGRHRLDAKHVAACCALNGPRALPAFIEGLWMRGADDELLALQIAPSELRTTVDGRSLCIVQETAWPFDSGCRFTVVAEGAIDCTLRIRIPNGSRVAELPDDAVIMDGFVELRRCWAGEQTFTLGFEQQVSVIGQPATHAHPEGGVLIECGPLVYAEAIASERSMVEEHGCGFGRWQVTPLAETPAPGLGAEARFTRETCADGDALHPWAQPPLVLRGRWADGRPAELRPMGSSMLRRVVFPRG